MAQMIECAKGEVLFRENQHSPYIYFVLSGEVGLRVEESVGGSTEVYVAGEGDLLGWSPVLGRRAMTATARARTNCRLAVLPASQLMDYCKTDPTFAAAFLKEVALVLSQRLTSTRRQLARVIHHGSPLAGAAEGSD
jgi:CRP-like cAMP-binding protein